MSPKKGFTGFTLIELLVVIAIISLMSSIVLAALNSARIKAADASIKSNMIVLHTQGALYFDSHSDNYGTAGNCSVLATGTLSGACTGNIMDDTTIVDALKSVAIASDKTVFVSISSGSVPSWIAVSSLSENPNYRFCVDSYGVSKLYLSPLDGGTRCP